MSMEALPDPDLKPVWSQNSNEDWTIEIERDGQRIRHHNILGVAEWDEALGPATAAISESNARPAADSSL